MRIEVFFQLGVGHVTVVGEVVDKILSVFINETEFRQTVTGFDNKFTAHVVVLPVIAAAGAIVENHRKFYIHIGKIFPVLIAEISGIVGNHEIFVFPADDIDERLFGADRNHVIGFQRMDGHIHIRNFNRLKCLEFVIFHFETGEISMEPGSFSPAPRRLIEFAHHAGTAVNVQRVIGIDHGKTVAFTVVKKRGVKVIFVTVGDDDMAEFFAVEIVTVLLRYGIRTEVDADKLKYPLGVNIAFVTTAKDNASAMELLRMLELPFEE